MAKSKGLIIATMVLLLVALPLLSACGEDEEEEIVLTFATFIPGGSGLSVYEETWQAEITERTDGRVTFENYYSASLVGAKESLDATKTGLADIAHVAASYVGGRNETMTAVVLPTIFRDLAIAQRVINEYGQQKVPDDEAKGEGVIYIHAPLIPVIMAANKPVETLDDWEGLRLHTSGLQADVQRALGATVTTLTTPEVGTALERGTLDGVAGFAYANLIPMGISPYVDYVVDAKLGITGLHTVMNRDVWEDLPDDIQDIITEVGEDMPELWAAIQVKERDEVVPQLEAEGIIISQLSSDVIDQIYEIAAPIVAKKFTENLTSKGLPGDELWSWLIETRDKYRKEAGLPAIPPIEY